MGKTEIHFPPLEGMKAAYSENGVELGLDVFLEIILDSVSLQVQDNIVERESAKVYECMRKVYIEGAKVGMQIHLPRLCMRA